MIYSCHVFNCLKQDFMGLQFMLRVPKGTNVDGDGRELGIKMHFLRREKKNEENHLWIEMKQHVRTDEWKWSLFFVVLFFFSIYASLSFISFPSFCCFVRSLFAFSFIRFNGVKINAKSSRTKEKSKTFMWSFSIKCDEVSTNDQMISNRCNDQAENVLHFEEQRKQGRRE